MNLGTIWVRFMEKTSGRKSRATVPLSNGISTNICILYNMKRHLLVPDTRLPGTWIYIYVLYNLMSVINIVMIICSICSRVVK